MPKAKLIHLATHGYSLPGSRLQGSSASLSNSMRGLKLSPAKDRRSSPTAGTAEYLSGIVLAGANRLFEANDSAVTLAEDGFVTAAEAESVDLRNTELVVLAACDSGLGQWVSAEGVVGLPRAFQIAGSQFVVSSLWKVEDAATRLFMGEFYRGILTRGAGAPTQPTTGGRIAILLPAVVAAGMEVVGTEEEVRAVAEAILADRSRRRFSNCHNQDAAVRSAAS